MAKRDIIIFVSIVVVALLYAFVSNFIKLHPYLAVLIGTIIVFGIGLLVYYSIKNAEFKEKEIHFFAWVWNIITSLMKQGSEAKERKPIPKDTYNKVYDIAADKCQICGKAGNLKIHHIDGNPSHNSITNLILLCGNHHDDADKGVISKPRLKDARTKQKTAGVISVSN